MHAGATAEQPASQSALEPPTEQAAALLQATTQVFEDEPLALDDAATVSDEADASVPTRAPPAPPDEASVVTVEAPPAPA